MKNLKYLEIREQYLEYLKERGHHEIPSSSLVPENDPSVLFVNSGMFPLVPFLLGEEHPNGTRLTDSQRCLRTIDIDEVGDDVHLTTFEMLGNWSLNDYFKEEAINITIGFLTDVLGYDINKIYGSVFEGDSDAPIDEESIRVWKELFKKHGIDAESGKGERIQLYDKSQCWWELEAGGPCGPCSEIFYDTDKEPCGAECHINCDCGKYVELGNNVFMEYLKKDGTYSPLGRHNVDFGGGLDRWAMIAQKVDNVYESDIYLPILNKVRELSSEEIVNSQRVIVDHLKAAVWVITDGVVPGRNEREYILRRLIRRAIRHGKKLGINGLFTRAIGEIIIEQFKPIWDALEERREETLNILEEEEKKFNVTLEKGLRVVNSMIQTLKDSQFKNESGDSFKLYETYGFPAEMLLEELRNNDVEVDEEAFWANHDKAFIEHQEKSRTAAKGLFKGGLADTSDESTKLHTATHLLLAALWRIVGQHVYQKGSNITPERLRLDFPNEEKLTDEQIKAIEDLVNEQIEKGLAVSWIEMKKEEALEKVPYASFAERYGEMVKVYTIGDPADPFSVEICNGPHVENTGKLGKFKILKQENVGSGIKRIKAALQ